MVRAHFRPAIALITAVALTGLGLAQAGSAAALVGGGATAVGSVKTAPDAPKVKPGLSKKVSELANAPTASGPKKAAASLDAAALSTPSPNQTVSQLQADSGESLNDLTAPIVQFAGQTSPFTPPDTVGDVGPNHYVQMVNSQFQIFNKQGASPPAGQPAGSWGPFQINSLWTSNSVDDQGCDTQNAGDPIVLYDQLADRWMLAQFTSPRTAPFDMCIAYSQTPDPTGAYHTYAFRLPRSHDYEKFGIWPDGLYMSTWEGGNNGAYVFDRATMLNGGAASFQDLASIGSSGQARGQRLLPSDWDGAAPPPAGSPNYFIQSDDNSDQLQIYAAHVDWQDPSQSTFTNVTNLGVAAYSADVNCADTDGDGAFRNCVPQPGTLNRVDNLANRLMHRLQYRNFGTYEAMVTNQTIDDGSDRHVVRWYELRKSGGGAWAVYQQGTYGPGTTAHRWMGSAAMDRKGNIALGYSISDPTNNVFPSVAYTGRRADAPLGLMPEPEFTMFAGTTSQTTSDRWGDYSAMTVDPTDDCTFWYTQMHSGNSATRIGSFRFNSCLDTDLAIAKTDTPDPVYAGQVLQYDISVTNNGSTLATNVTVSDDLPNGLGFIGSSKPCTGVDPKVCNLGSLAPGASTSVNFQLQVPSNFLVTPNLASLAITNTATVSSDQPDANPADNTASAVTTVRESADLAVTKICKPDSAGNAGDEGFCTLYVDNNGPSDARSVALSDTLTASTPFTVSAISVTPNGACTPAVPIGPTASTAITCLLGAEPSGGRTEVKVTFSTASAGDVNDVATASSLTDDPVIGNNTATGRVSFVSSADVSIEKSAAPDPVLAGTSLTWTLSVANAGPSTAQNVVVKDVLPAGVSFVSATPTVGSCSAGQPGNPLQPVTCTLGSMTIGATASIAVVVTVNPDTPKGTLLSNSARVSSDTGDPDNADNVATATATVDTRADLGLTKSVLGTQIAGTQVTYRFQLSNAGPSVARSVTLRDLVPAGMTFLSAFQGSGTGNPVGSALPCQLVTGGSNEWDCPVGDRPVGGSAYELLVNALIQPSVPKGTVLTNNASLLSETSDLTPAAAFVAFVVDTRADLRVVKTSDLDWYKPSANIIYTITVTNLGPSDAQPYVIKDNLPSVKQAIYRFDTGGCTLASNVLTCPQLLLPAGGTISFNVHETIKGSKGVVSNTAFVSSAGTVDPVPANNTSTRSTLIKGSAR